MGTALITGAASLMGEGIAKALAKGGWDLALTDINTSGAEQVAASLSGNVRVEVTEMDVTDPTRVREVVGHVSEEKIKGRATGCRKDLI